MIGIMPRIAAAAVSMIGRNLWVVASITAFQGSTPCARSCSIWWTRITELRMIMPASAMMPSVAMKPIGVLVVSSAVATPMRPSGATLITMASWRKLPSCTMSTVSIRVIMSGNWASRAALLCALFSTVPPVSSQRARRHRPGKLVERVGDALVNEGRLQSWQRVAPAR